MKKEIIQGIEIQYDESQISKIEHIKNIISNNIFLLSPLFGPTSYISLIPSEDEEALYIEDFDKFFSDTISTIVNEGNMQDTLNTPDFLEAIYVETLIKKLAKNQKTLIEPNPDINHEILDFFASYKYFEKNGCLEDFINYLKERKDSDKIIKWLANEIRFEVYNYLLKTTVNHLKKYDFVVSQNLNNIVNKMGLQFIENINYNRIEKSQELPSLNINELDNLFIDFLETINAPNDWQEIYKKLRTNNKIIFEPQKDNIDNSACYLDDNDDWNILITTDGTIVTFCTLVHEFIHYISRKKETKIPKFSISEFPSIFFEKLSAEFLKGKGYSDSIVTEALRRRNQNNIDIYMVLSPLFNDIGRYINKGQIQKVDKVKLYEEQFRIIIETREKIKNLAIENGCELPEFDNFDIFTIDIEEAVNRECDALINEFIVNGLLVVNGYQYLLDTLLADEVLKKSMADPNSITKMIEITNELSNVDLKDILNIFDMQAIFDNTESFDKGITRTRKPQ